MCGPDSQRKSDGCIYMYRNKFISYENNGTNNHGVGGGGLFSFWYTFDGTFAKFSQVYKCFDDRFIEIIGSTFTTSFCNFIGASNQSAILWISEKVPIFEDCIFINISGKGLSGDISPILTRCISNDNYPGMTFSSFPSTYQIILGNSNCKLYKCSRNNDSIYSYPHYIFIYILILLDQNSWIWIKI